MLNISGTKYSKIANDILNYFPLKPQNYFKAKLAIMFNREKIVYFPFCLARHLIEPKLHIDNQ
jgi:hypothetical protein